MLFTTQRQSVVHEYESKEPPWCFTTVQGWVVKENGGEFRMMDNKEALHEQKCCYTYPHHFVSMPVGLNVLSRFQIIGRVIRISATMMLSN